MDEWKRQYSLELSSSLQQSVLLLPTPEPDCLEKAPMFFKHMLCTLCAFSWSHLIISKKHDDEKIFISTLQMRRRKSQCPRCSLQGIREPQGRLRPPDSLRVFFPVPQSCLSSQPDSQPPQTLSGFSALGEWVSFESILDAVIIL